MTEAEALLWITLCPDLNPRTRRSVLRRQGSALAAKDWLERQKQKPPEAAVWKRSRDSQWVARGHAGYPERLLDLDEDAPEVLFYLGDLERLQGQELVAVIGTRNATGAGLELARRFSLGLAEQGFGVLSGLARGVDGVAHEAALQSPCSRPVAVVGCGLDHCYPAENRHLMRRVAERGVVFSEYAPGVMPQKWHFPARNRVLAALARAVLVIEAPQRSGTLITADFALKLDRDVFALPGPVTHPNYQGNLSLLEDGAALARSPGTLADQLRGTVGSRHPETGVRTASPEEWARELGLSLVDTLAQLSLWESAGLVERDPCGHFRRSRR